MSDLSAPKQDRKRQARGQARIESLLRAAEEVFAVEGYHGATTNEISATAGVSPATLYQFFLNKDAIANALTICYADQLGQLHESMDFEAFALMPLADMVSGVVDPLLSFHKSHPAFLTLLLDAPLSKETMAAKHAMAEKFMTRLSAMFRARNPELKAADAEWATQMFMIIYKGFIGEITNSAGPRKVRLVRDFKALVVCHLQGHGI